MGRTSSKNDSQKNFLRKLPEKRNIRMAKSMIDGWDVLRKIGIKGWWLVAKDREDWRKVLREAEALVGL